MQHLWQFDWTGLFVVLLLPYRRDVGPLLFNLVKYFGLQGLDSLTRIRVLLGGERELEVQVLAE